MKKAFLAISLLLATPIVIAGGQGLHDAACMQCHATLMGGDANAIYTRNTRRVKDLNHLNGQVKGCALAAGVAWLPEEHQQVVDYLAKTFYRF
ncbi:MAG: hypothetical protein HN475_02230 [Piscirickettsiaceae bacterium]|jgi:hypothetical protein|nr:hypothetical protein [Piscirickettsiaceae bacterium]